jgi:hypothetical protein
MGYKPNNKWRSQFKDADSKWEGELKEGILNCCDFKPDKMAYSIPHHYHPDFKIGDILIEAKGRFMDSAEARKYLYVRDYLPEGEELVFLFYNYKTPMPQAKKRKDGTKFTHGEWATKNKFRWFTESTITKILMKKEK